MNTLFSSGQVITVATGQNYTLKDNEVMANGALCRKVDLEITTSNNSANSNQDTVKVGIRRRDGLKNLPSNLESYDKWEIDGVQQTSLAQLVENLNTAIQ